MGVLHYTTTDSHRIRYFIDKTISERQFRKKVWMEKLHWFLNNTRKKESEENAQQQNDAIVWRARLIQWVTCLKWNYRTHFHTCEYSTQHHVHELRLFYWHVLHTWMNANKVIMQNMWKKGKKKEIGGNFFFNAWWWIKFRPIVEKCVTWTHDAASIQVDTMEKKFRWEMTGSLSQLMMMLFGTDRLLED